MNTRLRRLVPFESFTYPFFDLTSRVNKQDAVYSFLNPGVELTVPIGNKGLYIHVPFCDTICNFCPFIKNVGSDERIAAYVDAVITELQMIAGTQRIQSWNFNSIYVGGGTPSLLTEEQIERLLQSLKANLQLSSNCEITFEMEAKSVSRDKMSCLRESGVTRVSFGLQTFDERIRSILNLTATQDDIYNTIDLSTKFFPFANNMDVIVGLPGQTELSMFKDLEQVVACGIDTISIYPMDYVMTLPGFLDLIRRKEIPAPPNAECRIDMFYTARMFLREHFVEQNIYCYGKSQTRPCRYMFETVYGQYQDEYIGVGCGSYSYLGGLSTQNISNEQQYVSTVKSGQLPVQAISFYHPYEKGIVFFPKRMQYDIRDLERLNMLPLYSERIEHLISEGLITQQENLLTLTDEGAKYYAWLMVEFFSESQRRLYSLIVKRLESQVGVTAEQAVPTQKPKVRTSGSVTAMKAV